MGTGKVTSCFTTRDLAPQLLSELGLDGGGVVGGRFVLLKYEFVLRVDHLDPRYDVPIQELVVDKPVGLFVRVDEDDGTAGPTR